MAMIDLQLKYEFGEDGKRHLTIPDDVKAYVISFIRENAAKPPDQIAAVVQEGHDELHAALAGLSEAQAAWKPGPEDWSILELMDHVASVKRIMAIICRSLSQGTLPPGIDETAESESRQDGITIAKFSTLAEAREAVDAAHNDLMAFVATINDGMNTDKHFRHFVFGAMNCRQWAVFQRIHDADHAPGIGKIKATPGFPAV